MSTSINSTGGKQPYIDIGSSSSNSSSSRAIDTMSAMSNIRARMGGRQSNVSNRSSSNSTSRPTTGGTSSNSRAIMQARMASNHPYGSVGPSSRTAYATNGPSSHHPALVSSMNGLNINSPSSYHRGGTAGGLTSPSLSPISTRHGFAGRPGTRCGSLPSRDYEGTSYNFLDHLRSEMIKLHVGKGEDKRTFAVHKKPLCAKSPYFTKMFNIGMIETYTGEVNIPEETPNTVSALLDMTIYHEGITSLTGPPDETNDFTMRWDPVAVYALAMMWMLPAEILNSIMDQIIRHHYKAEELPSLDFVEAAFDKTPEGSKLRGYAVHGIVYALNRGQQVGDIGWPADEVQKLITAYPDFGTQFVALNQFGSVAQSTDPRTCFDEPSVETWLERAQL
ncbi:POZ [Glarea lozoyensis ATCC 20868]|uniref:POZ n=1 Tax=Glarea lozoyensis (strain ATCC 20868 / MF5171) TaxID=1116229 RepID=S3D2C3_GLAL2|nr:POZ [Glarea lozoyensis ATCC 20868]EPE31975.1 POZ [Glarea lozoyensis ATCC 20868]